MKLATFNVNSLKARLPIVLEWLAAHQPDVLCLQEIKGMDIPEMELRGAGYHIYAHTQKAYNGVMTLSRAEMNVVATTLPGFPDDEHARVMVTSFVTPTLTLPPSGGGNSSAPTPLYIINIYAPNGNPVGTDKYTYKLRWLNALYNYLKDLREQGRDVW
jgi:exodeoxyribonuclease-3